LHRSKPVSQQHFERITSKGSKRAYGAAMATRPRPNLGDFPESPYAAQLRQADPNRRFAPALEAEYVRTHLIDSRTLIRTASVVALLLALSRASELVVSGSATGMLLAHLALVVCGSIVLAGLAWSPAFDRLYLPWAQVIVPVRNAIVAAHFAEAAAHGHLELLMVLPLMLIGPFFFMGLRPRTALLSGVLTTAAFILGAALFQLALPLALRSGLFLLTGLLACSVAAWQLEKCSRTSFLKGHLIAELAQHDALTGTKNRRVFDEHLARLWQQAAEDQRVIAILLIDIDHFKAYNDRYGHLAGDEALRRVAGAVQALVHRPLDLLARYGGEEFAVFLYDVDGSQAKDVADRMRCAVGALALPHRASRTSETVSISLGVAVIQPTVERDGRGALQLADQALYEAKLKGRNRVELMDDAQYQLLVTGVFPNAVADALRRRETPRPRRLRAGSGR
jgi:diguanylate cyclase (GGDEF)-like protein